MQRQNSDNNARLMIILSVRSFLAVILALKCTCNALENGIYITMFEEGIPPLHTINMGYTNGNSLCLLCSSLLHFFEIGYTPRK